MTSTRPCLLLVDDEERILRSLSMLFRLHYRVLATTDPQQALQWVHEQAVHVIVSDQKMPQMRGADLLREVRKASPDTMRILLTGYSELDAIVDSVNEGEIFRYVNKPWDAAELRATVDQAARVATAQFARPSFAPPPLSVGIRPAVAEAPAVIAPAAPSRVAAIASAPPGPAILVIDDDASVVEAIRETVGPMQAVHWARGLDEALSLLVQHPVGVIVSELVVQRESLTAVLKILKAEHPDVVTIVMTPFQDTGVLINLINQGQIFRLLPKPVRRGPLGMNIASALRHHQALKLSPMLRERHAVQAMKPAEEVSVAARVKGFLGRLRGRPANS